MGACDVFICYASPDVAVAQAICETLESHRIACWMAPRDIPAGEKYQEAIIQGIKSCRIMIFVFSSASNTSEHTIRELERAAHYQLTLIPVRIENVPPSPKLEYFLSLPHWLDAIGPGFRQQLPVLVATVAQQLQKTVPPRPAPLRPPPYPRAPAREVPRPPVREELRKSQGGALAQPWLWASVLGALLVLACIVILVVVLARPGPSAAEPGGGPGPAPTNATTGAEGEMPEAAQALANRGIQRMRQGAFAEAEADFTAAIKQAPRFAQLYAFRAQAYGQLKDYDSAIGDWTRCIALAPESHEGYSGRGQDYLHQNNPDSAIRDFQKVIDLLPDVWLGYDLMGDAYRAKGDHKNTLRYYQESIKRGPADPAAGYYFMGIAAGKLGDAAQSAAYRTKARSLDPQVEARLSGRP